MKANSKNKPKGTEYNVLKNIKKAARIVKTNEDRRRAENKRLNSESRKEKRIEKDFYERVSQIEIIDFSKGMMILSIEGNIEKRNLTYGRRSVKLSENLEFLPNFEVKLFGEQVEIRRLANFEEMKERLAWAISEE